MDTRQVLHRSPRLRSALACASLFGLFPALVIANGTRTAQNARPGEIAVLRNVATRPADRAPTSPGMALLVNASPAPLPFNSGLMENHDADEVGDADIARLNAGPAAGGVSVSADIRRLPRPVLGADANRHFATANSNNPGIAGGVQNVGGPIVDSTRNISHQVTATLTQMPLLGATH